LVSAFYRACAPLDLTVSHENISQELKMKRTDFLRLFALAACLACASASALAQQPAPRTRRGGLDNLSLPSRAASPSASADAADGWQLVAPDGESFSVRMPATPSMTAKEGRDGGEGRSYRVELGGVLYEVTRTNQIPKALFGIDNFEQDFLDSLSGSLPLDAAHEWPQMQLQLVNARPFSVGSYDGRHLELASARYRSSVRAFIVNRSLLIVAMTGQKSAFTPEQESKFFGSLRLN
jgi:hypothetical protein